VIYLDPDLGAGAKVRLDGFSRRGTVEQLFALATPQLRPTRGRVAVVVTADEIVVEPVEWLWPGRLARGMLTNLVGIPTRRKA
jgi:hypothetical protein